MNGFNNNCDGFGSCQGSTRENLFKIPLTFTRNKINPNTEADTLKGEMYHVHKRIVVAPFFCCVGPDVLGAVPGERQF
ncbi:hypothetical protein GCM10011571_15550 [Marinithermofilum abyssi]|uniref:Uncharacterized protein n=1 Tax=Marinithermofilum abyssi TaxID=1571185 RepID=A0A8J2VDP1_9BACL|nr:hypothetical protein GCM10011571_15550 [Marinithermofilum abyssi]